MSLQLPKIIRKTLSVRLSFLVVSSMALLLMASLFVMLFYSRRAVKEEALQKASQTLESTVQRIDNLLLSVEQTTGNIYFSLVDHMNQPEMVLTHSRQVVESNPYIAGCAIAFKPYYYEGQEYFMAYVYRTATDGLAFSDAPIIQAETFGNCPYTEQVWFTKPMATGKPCWLNPLEKIEADVEPITTFCLPIPGPDGKPVGVIGVDVSLNMLSKNVLASKPSPNSYSTLLTADGAYLVHPDSLRLNRSIFEQEEFVDDPSMLVAAKAMSSGETGYKPFRMSGTNYYVFYKPFKRVAIPVRSNEDLGWSVGVIYPAAEIWGDYNRLFYYVLAIAVCGLLILFLLCKALIHRQLKPMLMLTASAQRIADGDYEAPIPDSHQHDEIGRLQDSFQQMQQSLAAHVSELEQLTATLQEQGEELRRAYEKVKKADSTKTTFLHNVTDQMLGPANAIEADVAAICDRSKDIDREEAIRLVTDIHQQGKAIAELLNDLLQRIES